MKCIYWSNKERGTGFYIIQFWTKSGNALTFKTVTIEEQKLRNKITDMTGIQQFSLEHVKEKR